MITQVKRIWQNQAGTLLVLYIVLDQLPFVISRLQGDIQAISLQRDVGLFAFDAFLAWRIWGGGRISWAILLLINLVDLVSLILVTGPFGSWILSPYLIIFVLGGGIILLLSPAIRHRLGPARRT
jgi:hypothetical protein